jgi:hypothetical protein
MIMCFKEKHGKRFVQGSDQESILAYVLQDRLSDTYGAMFGGGDDDVSVWYDEDTEVARKMLGEGKATRFMQSRIAHEYEGWEVIQVEVVGE